MNRPQDFDLQQYDNDTRYGFGEGKKIKLKFRVNKDIGDYPLETQLPTVLQVKEFDDEYEIMGLSWVYCSQNADCVG